MVQKTRFRGEKFRIGANFLYLCNWKNVLLSKNLEDYEVF